MFARFCGALLLGASLLMGGGAFAAGGHNHGTASNDPCADREAPASLRCAVATTATFHEGRLWTAWAFGGHVYVNHSDDRGKTFSPPMPVNRVPERVAADGENRPKVTVGPEGGVYVAWTQRLSAPYTGNIRFSRSLDGGRTFSEPVTINDDRHLTSHRFESLTVNEQGTVYLAWLDKRDRVAEEEQGGTYRGAALYYTLSEDRGESFLPDRKVADHTCECCRTAMTTGPDGLPVVVWRHIYGKNVRDHALTWFTGPDAPGPMRRLSRDMWHIDACPHHGPAVSVTDNGVLHAAWFNNAEDRHGLFYAHSEDQGKTIQRPVSVGRYEAGAAHPDVLSLGRRVYLLWKEFDGEKTGLYTQASSDGGQTWSPARRLAETAGPSDHPFLVRDGERVFASWQTRQEGYRLLPAAE